MSKKEGDFKAKINCEGETIVLFYASWCPFSRSFLPIFSANTKNEDRTCLKVKIDNEPALTEEYSVEVYPTIIIFENGQVKKRLNGLHGVGLNQKRLIELLKL